MAKRHTVSARFLLLLFSTDGWLVSGALTKSSSVQPPTTKNCSLRQDRDAADDRRRRQDGKRWASEIETGKQERLSLNFTYSIASLLYYSYVGLELDTWPQNSCLTTIILLLFFTLSSIVSFICDCSMCLCVLLLLAPALPPLIQHRVSNDYRFLFLYAQKVIAI